MTVRFKALSKLQNNLSNLVESARDVVETVRKGARGTEKLLDKKGRYCALGALLHSTGREPKIGQETLTDAQVRRLQKWYPVLTLVEDFDPLYALNDKNNTAAQRAAAFELELQSLIEGDIASQVGY